MNFTKKVFDSRMERTLEELQDERAIAIDSQIERDFTLTEEPLCNFASHNVEMMRGNLECSLLDYLFFSNRNIKIIQNMIRKTVFDISKYIIDNQSENELLVIIRSIFYLNLQVEFKNVTENIKFLNKKVVDHSVPTILSNMKQYLIYLKDVQRVSDPIKRPNQESIKGVKQLDFKGFF